MNILDQIVAGKKESIEQAKKKATLKELATQCEKTNSTPTPLSANFKKGKLAIISEMKKRSPSVGEIMKDYDPRSIAKTYEAGGAGAISVLTEEKYFAGSAEHLRQAKKASRLPILRKDFTIDPYQVYESKLLGASAVLLIVAILTKKTYSELIRLARELGLGALVEVHSEPEIETALSENPEYIGINNRNLKDLKIDLHTTFDLLEKIPKVCFLGNMNLQEIMAK